jgi:hypothetical protein
MRIAIRLIVSLGALSLLAGCSAEDPVSAKSIRGDPAPELRGVGETSQEGSNNLAVYMNVNSREFMDDIARTFYTDHPSRLSPYPIVYTSGNAR